ncbi:MAG: RMD1 family protein [Alphaproteobacteria bacterium]
MRCIAYSTAESYTLKKLADHFQSEGAKCSLHNKEVLHLPRAKEKGDIFFFDYGCVVFWNVPKKTEHSILETLKNFSAHPYHKQESDEFEYEVSRKEPKTLISNGVITLSGTKVFKKLVVSFALSQSVKLMTFEEVILNAIEDTRNMPEEMALHGKVSLSRKEISQKMGRIFIVRHSVNLHTEMLDIPEFFWEYPEYESLYKMILKDFDVPQRLEVLNRRMEMIQELFSMLGGELNHQHSSLLEWIIIILISVEIALFLLKEVWKIV